jgi:outer membrane immunogenic protein
MKKLSKNLLLASALSDVLANSTASAGIFDQFKIQNGVTPDNHFTISAQAGYGTQDLPTDVKALGYDTNVERKMNGFSWHGAIGYSFAVSPTFSLGPEVGYGMIPSTEYNIGYSDNAPNTGAQIKWSAHYMDVLAVGELKFNPKFSVFAKAGAAYVGQKIMYSGSADLVQKSVDKNKSDYSPEAGLGLGFKFNDNVMLTLTGNYIFASHIGGSVSDITGVDSNEKDDVKVASFVNVMLGLTFFI